MKLLSILVMMLLSGSIIAQENMSEKELEALIRKAEKMAEKAKADPRMKQAMAEEEEENKPKRFPARDNLALAAIPARPMNDGSLSSYLRNLYTAYKTKVPVGAIQAMQKATDAFGGNADKMAIAGVSAWYNGAEEAGILLLMQAGIKKTEDPLLLNNLGALLNASGAARHALPLLHTLVSRYPENPMLLNNLGQAYAGVGQLDTAMKYFNRVFKKSPQHPEARNTAGQIEKQRGRTSEAIKHFQESLKGAYNLEAIQGLSECTNGNYYAKLPLPGTPINLPYFNEFKYKLPRQCSGPADAPFIKQEHEDFRNFVGSLAAAYSNLAAAERREGEAILEKEGEKTRQKLMQALKTGAPFNAAPTFGSPINIAAARKIMEAGMRMATVDYPDHDRRMAKLDSNYQGLIREYKRKSEKIAAEYAEKKSKYDCGEGRGADCAAIQKLSKEECEAQVALGNAAQGAISAARTDWQNEHLRFIRSQFEFGAFYGYLAGFNQHMARGAFYDACNKYLTELKTLAYDPFVCAGQRCDDKFIEANSKEESDGTKEMECPIDIDVKFIVGKIKLNCEKFEFTAGEGLIFTATKSFTGKKQTTMSLGAGLQFEGSKEWGIFSGEVSANASQSFYIVWDKDDKIIDGGLALKAEGSIKGEAKVELPGGIGKDQLPQKEIKIEGEFGYTLGVSSGWTFNDGSLSKIAKSVGVLK